MEAQTNKLYMYVVRWDLGFAPNPFGGVCSLACCKPEIRRLAQPGDWVVGMGGGELKATGRCVFAMRVSEAITFDEYWIEPRFRLKRPARNGSMKKLVGDNIYHHDDDGKWVQDDSVHSGVDGVINAGNLSHDTRVNRILLSDHFIYFGASAPAVPSVILQEMGYKNPRNRRTFSLAQGSGLIEWIESTAKGRLNAVIDDPFDFADGFKRFNKEKQKFE